MCGMKGSRKNMSVHQSQSISMNTLPDAPKGAHVDLQAGKFYWYRFVFDGKLIRESTKQGNDKVARQMEAAHRTALAKGEVGIREKKPAPTLKEFLESEFLPYANTAHATK